MVPPEHLPPPEMFANFGRVVLAFCSRPLPWCAAESLYKWDSAILQSRHRRCHSRARRPFFTSSRSRNPSLVLSPQSNAAHLVVVTMAEPRNFPHGSDSGAHPRAHHGADSGIPRATDQGENRGVVSGSLSGASTSWTRTSQEAPSSEAAKR